jgi:hypothetical protein
MVVPPADTPASIAVIPPVPVFRRKYIHANVPPAGSVKLVLAATNCRDQLPVPALAVGKGARRALSSATVVFRLLPPWIT